MFRRVLGGKKKDKEGAKVSETGTTGTIPDKEGLTIVPKDTLGLHVLSEPGNGDAKVDIVAVHGLGGNSFSTWTHSNGVLWLRDLLPTESKDARIMTYGYDVGMFTKARTERSFTFAEGLLTELRDLRPGEARTRPLFFIAHSLGGIVVKKVLIIAKSRPTQYGDIIDSTRHLMFFGTPHQGTTSMAGFLRRLGASLSSEGSVLRELELWSPQVHETNSAFLTEIAPMFTITTFWEREKIAGVQVVDEGSARLHQTHEDVIGLDADHRSMCKFKDADDNKFIKTIRRLQAEISNLNEQPLNMKDERIKDLLKNNELAPYLKSLNAAQLQLEVERWITQEYSAGLKHEFRDWIDPPTFDDNDFLKHHSKLSKRDEKSAQWIFEQNTFKSWESGESRLLWVCGRPGCGKSVLASNVVHHFRHRSSYQTAPAPMVVYAFCDKQDEGKKFSASLLRTLLWQIVSSDKLSISQQLEIIHDCRRTFRGQGVQPNASTDHRFAYMSSLLEKYTQMLPVVIILDGLDECYDPDLLASLVVQPGSFQSDRVRIWVSSQKIHTISRHLDRCPAKIDMEDENIRSLTDGDIRQYVRTELSATESPVISQNIDEMTEAIASKANGMFLWAAISVPEVQAKAEAPSNDLEQLRESIGDLPENMEETFVHLLNRILRSVSNLGARANEQRRNKLLQILRWSFHAVRPLTVCELNEAMTIVPYGHEESQKVESTQSPDISGLLRSLYPLIYVSEETVHLMHATFRSFVLPPGDTEPVAAVVEILGSQSFQSELATQCVVYLSRPYFKNFILLSSNSDLTKKFALFQYATVNWITHVLNDPNVNTVLKNQLHDFLSTNQAITWLEQYMAHNIDGIKTLQSQLYRHQGYVADPKWILKILIDSVEERMERDPDSVKTDQMTSELGTLYRYHGMAKDAATIFEKVYRKQKALTAPNSHKLRHAINNLALAKSDLNQLHEAKQLFEELLDIFRASADGDTEDAITALNNLASVYHRLGHYSKAVELSAQHLARTRTFYGDRHVNTCLAYNNFGHACLSVGRVEVAKEHVLRAFQLYTEIQGKDSDGALLALNNLAAAESALGNGTEALRLSEHLWTTRQNMLGKDHPDTLLACQNYSYYLFDLDRVNEALALLENLVHIQQKLRGPAHSKTLVAQANFAEALERLGRYGEALGLQRRTLDARKRILGISHPDTLLSMLNYANALRKDYKFREARSLLVDCLSLYSRTLGLYHERTITAMRSMSGFCEEQNHFHLAEHLAIRALHLTKVTHSGDHRSTLLSEIFCAIAMRALDKSDAAEVVLKRVLRLARRASIEEVTIVLGARAALSSTHRYQGDYNAALDMADQVVGRCETRGMRGKDVRQWLLAGWEQRGLALGKLERHEEALDMLKKVQEERVKDFGPESNARLSSQCNLALCHLNVGDVEAAQDLIQPVLKTWLELLGKAHSLTGMAMAIQAKCYCRLGKYAEAKSLQLEAIAVRQTALGSRHLLTLRTRHDYARILFESGDNEAAEQAMMDVLRDERRYLRKDHPHTTESAMYSDKIRAKLGKDLVSVPNIAPEENNDENEASAKLQALHKTLEEAEVVLGSDDPEILILQRELALAHEAALRKNDAISLLQGVLERQTEMHSATHPETMTTLVEVIRLTGGKDKTKKVQLSQALMEMIRTRSTKDLSLFRKILECNPDMTATDPETGYTALALAVHRNELDLVRCLLACGVDANTVESDGKTCLQIAVAAQLSEIVELLLKHKASPNVLDTKEKHSPLYLASAKGYIDIARILLERSANPNLPEDVPPLFAAAGYNHSSLVELLLHHGANIEVLSSEGMTPFLNSIFHGHLLMVELLHKRGANASAESSSGIRALHLACWKGSKPIVAFLIGIGQDVNESAMAGGFTPLHIAAEQGFWEIVEVLIQAGASLNSRSTNENAWTPLVSAAWAGRADIVGNILKIPGQTPNTHFGSLRATPLHYAASAGHVEVVDKLLTAGADVDALTIHGATALIEAVREGRLAVVETLLAAGANVDIESSGKTALTMSLLNGKVEIVEALVKHPTTNIDARIFGSVTILYLAIYLLPSSIVNLLLERGANTNLPSTECQHYPLHLAVELREHAYIQTLLDHSADQTLQDIFGRTAVDKVEADDNAFPMLSTDFRTSLSDQIAKAESTIANHALEISVHLESGKPKSDQFVRDKLEIMAQAFHILNAMDDERIALDQCIVWKETDNERVMEHTLNCISCRGLNSIVGTMYICTKCPSTALCAACYEGHWSGEKPCKACRHDEEVFFAIPGEGWVELDAEGFVCKDSETGRGCRFGEWLTEKSSI